MRKDKLHPVEALVLARVDELENMLLQSEQKVISTVGKSNYLRYGAVAERRMIKSLLVINNNILKYSFGYNIKENEEI